jgi:hypothetical protein
VDVSGRELISVPLSPWLPAFRQGILRPAMRCGPSSECLKADPTWIRARASALKKRGMDEFALPFHEASEASENAAGPYAAGNNCRARRLTLKRVLWVGAVLQLDLGICRPSIGDQRDGALMKN